MKDFQYRKTINAEYEVFPLASSKRLSEKECEKFLKRILTGGYYFNKPLRYKEIGIKFIKNENYSAAWNFNDKRLELPKWARTKETIIHELSHALTDAYHKIGSVPDHGQEFCTEFLNMVHCYISKKKALEMEQAYSKLGVKYFGSKLTF